MTAGREQDALRWGARAEALLRTALGEHIDGTDAIPAVDAALTALRIAAGEIDASAMDGYQFPGEVLAGACTCPPDLLTRGGFRSGCPAHG